MPELPEVETTLRGIEPHVLGKRVTELIVRRRDLRQPVPESIHEIESQRIVSITRRSKYLLFGMEDASTVLIHLGMSGSLRISPTSEDWRKHDHLAITLSNRKQLRYHDPRRFGLALHFRHEPATHPLLCHLGPEPLSDSFTPAHLHNACKARTAAIKLVIMDAKVVVGVGNIYASESLFRAGIRPRTAARRLSKPRIERLATAIREVLSDAISQGGTTLRDFLHSDGQPGYFKQQLFVYDRANQPCRNCETPIKHAVLGQRATYWCPKCQT